MVENLDASLNKAAAAGSGSQPIDGLIQQTSFIPPITRVQSAGEPLPLTPDAPEQRRGQYDPDLDALKGDMKQLEDWDKQAADERRQQKEARNRQNQHEPTVAELIEKAQKLFESGKDKAGAIDLFEQAIRKADAQGQGTLRYAQGRLQMVPPDEEPDPALKQRLAGLVEHSVDQRVNARYALADALESSGDKSSAQAVRDDAVQIYLSMIVPLAHAEKRAQEDRMYDAIQQQPPVQWDI